MQLPWLQMLFYNITADWTQSFHFQTLAVLKPSLASCALHCRAANHSDASFTTSCCTLLTNRRMILLFLSMLHNNLAKCYPFYLISPSLLRCFFLCLFSVTSSFMPVSRSIIMQASKGRAISLPLLFRCSSSAVPNAGFSVQESEHKRGGERRGELL